MSGTRDQGSRPTCLAFTLSDLNREFAPAPGNLSAEYLYCQALASSASGSQQRLTLQMGLDAVLNGQPEETHAPYQATEPPWPICVPTLPVGTTLFRSAFAGWSLNLGGMEAALRTNRPVGLGIWLTSSFLSPTNGIVAFERHALQDSGHAVVAVGLGEYAGVKYVRIRNSWGPGWGEAGYAWLPREYLETHAICIFGEASWRP